MKRAAGVAASMGLVVGGGGEVTQRDAVGEVCLSDAQLSTSRASPTLNQDDKKETTRVLQKFHEASYCILLIQRW